MNRAKVIRTHVRVDCACGITFAVGIDEDTTFAQCPACDDVIYLDVSVRDHELAGCERPHEDMIARGVRVTCFRCGHPLPHSHCPPLPEHISGVLDTRGSLIIGPLTVFDDGEIRIAEGVEPRDVMRLMKDAINESKHGEKNEHH